MGFYIVSYLFSCNAFSLQRFIRASMCLHPCVPYSELFFSPIIEEVPETMSICVFEGKSESWR